MARTKGSGWGAGPLNYIKCPSCGRKKALLTKIDVSYKLRCTYCKKYNEQPITP